ncbi:hypothetical protein EMPS_01382 [Entomortierella parvispora]|uniref:DUF8032 domain-containing protein n=1 Tax=Entomortierella parvispora TaxID=205924 RepID=A0A9P3H2Q5_9FUNG|nr:hypothetical protein EMPS_01382 [Entomortierella parvispora]
MPLTTQKTSEVNQGPLPASTEMTIPVQQLLQPNNEVIGLLSGLSVQELAAMEATLHQAKMVRMQSIALNAANSPPVGSTSGQKKSPLHTRQDGPQNMLQGVFPILDPTQRVPQPSIPPALEVDENGTWLSFSYSSKSVRQSYRIKADIDAVQENDIASDLRQSNCLYPSANGPEQDYKGSRLGYERECNTQGWKLVHLNPNLLTGKRGLLQQAVISLRNVTSEQKSRRARRKEKSKGDTLQQSTPLSVPNPSIVPPQLVDPGGGQSLSPVYKQTRQLAWQLPLTPGSPRRTQRPTRMARPIALDLVGSSVSEHTVDLSSRPTRIEEHQWHLRLPTLGSFSPVPELDLLLDFEGYDQGRFKNLTILCDVNRVQLDDLSLEFKKANCVYPRSFLTGRTRLDQWNTSGVKQAEESYLNELGWRLCSLNRPLLDGKRLLLQQALDAYRRKFLPLTCHPRARIGASLLTRRNSSTLHSMDNHSSELYRRKSKAHVQLDVGDNSLSHDSSRAWAGSRSKDPGLFGEENETDAQEDEDGVHETDDMHSEEADDEESEEQVNRDNDSDDEDDDNSSSEGEGSLYGDEFHSEMSLLTFTGSIQTYSLGSGSGSARSRPRLNPSDLGSMQSPSSPSLDPPRRPPAKKRGFEDPLLERSSSRKDTTSPLKTPERKRRKETSIGGLENADELIEIGGRKDSGMEAEEEENEEQTRPEVETETEDENSTGSYNEQDDEDNWWKSRLDNSEYPEDHDFVSMTTEELIGALTSGYVDDYDDEDDDD